LITNAIAMGALLEVTRIPPKQQSPKPRQNPKETDPIDN
jgi:hypothetical protein